MSKLVVVLTISDCILQVIAFSGQRHHICSESTDQVEVMECNFPEGFKPNKGGTGAFFSPAEKITVDFKSKERTSM